MLPERRPMWPIVIGTIAIVLGAGGVLANGCGGIFGNIAVALFAGYARSRGALDPVTDAQLGAIREFAVLSVSAAALSAAIAAVLLVGAIRLVGRRRSSVAILRAWASLKIVYAVPLAALSYALGTAQFDAMEQAALDSGSPMPTGIITLLSGVGVAGSALALLWAWAFPVFLFIWFARSPVKEEIEKWQERDERSVVRGYG